MTENNLIDKIQKSFSRQAGNFENTSMSFSKQEYLDYTVNSIGINGTESVLEVASGTCACGRAIAPYVRSVTCIDATPAMLEAGKMAAAKDNISNITFVEGLVEALPFPDENFDIVITRLSFHHLSEINTPFSEMDRVLKTGGKLVVIDMEAASEELRKTEDKIETMRDFSHVKNRSKVELESLFQMKAYEMIKVESTPIPVGLLPWMQLTHTSAEIQAEITGLMEAELSGGIRTGFAPYRKDGQIFFDQRWLFMLGMYIHYYDNEFNNMNYDFETMLDRHGWDSIAVDMIENEL